MLTRDALTKILMGVAGEFPGGVGIVCSGRPPFVTHAIVVAESDHFEVMLAKELIDGLLIQCPVRLPHDMDPESVIPTLKLAAETIATAARAREALYN